MAFSFAFSGDDIEPSESSQPLPAPTASASAAAAPITYGAFPVAGKPQLPAARHSLPELLARLPSKIALGYLDVKLDDGTLTRIPRRELWDVRVQLMAEDENLRAGGVEGLGEHDVKTGVYEGGFKSWESSVDLVKTLAATRNDWVPGDGEALRIIELGCGTALPSLALFQWAITAGQIDSGNSIRNNTARYHFAVADYNPTVLQLVTLPNFILSWALLHRGTVPALEQTFAADDDELDLTPEVLQAFQTFLKDRHITLSLLSGAWSPELVAMIYEESAGGGDAALSSTLLLGAETIYSPFALAAFTEMTFSILEREQERARARVDGTGRTAAYIAAKRLYFGVGGSLDDFIDGAKQRGGIVDTLREETDGVRRGVVRCTLAGS